MALVRDNCKACKSSCEHAGKNREFICPNGISCKVTHEPSKTNGDQVRAMSDEELAKVLNAFTAYFDECNRSGEDISCKDCELYRLCSLNQGNALEWLKQPAED